MEKDLIIDVTPSDVTIALLENNRLTELHKEETSDNHFSVGDLCLGRVKKIMPALNAAFVDIGDDKDAFIHYLDLGYAFSAVNYFTQQVIAKKNTPQEIYSSLKLGSVLPKEGKISDVLKVGQPVLVQIVKEPISTKGSRLTSDISIAGRNLVLLPFSEKVNLSSKITLKEERGRLDRLVQSILPPNYGLIVRTAAEGKKAAVLDTELNSLIHKWEESWVLMRKGKTPSRLLTENSRITTVIRDLLNDTFNSIHVNDTVVFEEVCRYIATIAPEKEKIVKLYKGKDPIFDAFDINRQIRSSFGRVVPLRQGVYIIIEHTEALHVVDVNSGIRSKMGNGQEENAFEVNMVVAEELARQLRLRDLGGIIVVDFIDMDSSEHRQKLYKKMQELMATDRAKHNILPLTKFGLMQITRQRVRPAMEINTSEKCPTCNGTGKIAPSLLFTENIENQLAFFANEKKLKTVLLEVHPFIEAYLTKGLVSRAKKWSRKYGCKLNVRIAPDLAVTQARWLDDKNQKMEV
ncbi:MAG: Rne/Rng family ribonuclease [Bacteroidales bacterium]|nr:Rne/Rng family ribonuclease [Bacteroidales bacterium]MDD2771124.1 Rne/Rng family ribonuclease [Bacteroidales bacterium]MDD3104796.1 Rne/Rng family ribonuclease [Bacteroidales bacterium]MDD3549005.1 Rne/Rng family ribonuclease [Bacteroidales bacterium]MDD4064266.1 Rne/Rng family ribonuclease [Bacteroidales bacterium]